MKIFIRKTALFLMVFLLVFAVGCTKRISVGEATTEIVFLSNSVKPYDTAIPIMIAEFEKQNPNIKVKVEMLPTKSLWEAVEIKLSSKEPTPDVLFIDSPLTTTYVAKGYIDSLNDRFSADELAQYVDVCRQYGTVNGKLYAAPFVNSSQVLYYNTRLFDEAGIEHLSKDPEKRLTWEELVEIAKKLTIDKDGDGVPEVFGLGIAQISRPYQMLTMPESLGGKAIGKDGLTVSGILTDDAWITSCQFISDLFNVHKVTPKGVSASDMLAYFPSEKLAMLIGPDYNHLAYSKNENLTWDYAPYPYFRNGKPVTPTGSWSLGINKSSKNKDAAAKFIKFLTLYPSCIEWFNLDGHLPANKRTLEYIADNEKFTKWPFDIFTLINYESRNTAIPRPLSPGYLEYESLLTNAFEDIRNGGDVKAILENTEISVDRMLRKYT